jgi:hypothetical protein
MPTKMPRSQVILIAENGDGVVVERLDVPLDNYYGGGLPVVDSDDYRRLNGIRLLRGHIYGYKGNLMEEFVVKYDSDGRYIHSRAVHEDGTIVEG